jgi:hypothetical protein
MGYTLKIGEARLDRDHESTGVDCYLVRLDNAPAFGDPTDYENQRWPSYSAWADFCREFDLMDVMFNIRNKGAGEFEWKGDHYQPLLNEHPGAQPITRAHLEYVEAKVAAWKAAHPGVIAAYQLPKPDAKPIFGESYREEDYQNDPMRSPWLCRAEWLLFWLRWAVENCKQPVFVNS